MTSRTQVFETADRLWLADTKPSVRKIIRSVGGSARDVSPLLSAWWIERSSERRGVATAELATLEERFDEQRRFFLMQLDAERQKTREREQEIQVLRGQLARYRKLLGDTATSAEQDILAKETPQSTCNRMG